MKPPLFDYRAPETIADAVAALAADETARPLAGGQSLIPIMNFRLAAPGTLVDLRQVAALRGITVTESDTRVGAMTRQRALETHAAANDANPLIAEVLANVAHIVIRNRGTVGGSIAHADASAELPCLLLATGGSVRVTGPAGERSVAADDLFSFHMTTTLEQAEVLTEVRIPRLPPATGHAFQEYARRQGDYALAGVCTLITLGAGGICSEARLAGCGISDRPVRLSAAEDLLRGRAIDGDALQAAGEAAKGHATLPDDLQASQAYRADLLATLVGRTVAQAAARARDRAGD